MTDDRQSAQHSGNAGGGDAGAPPDRASAGDVTTTGHSAADVHGADAHAAHDAAGAHGGGHGDTAAAETSTLVPVTWKQLILPLLILLLVLILVAGPVSSAFQSKPAPPPPTVQPTAQPGSSTDGKLASNGAGVGITAGAPQPASSAVSPTPAPPEATDTTVPTAEPTITSAPVPPSVAATRTSVALDSLNGTVSREPVQLQIGGSTFVVKPGSGLLPDWKPSDDQGIATWIAGTYANHILYVPYSSDNDALFRASRPGDTIKLVMNTGQVFFFDVKGTGRAYNGPPSDNAANSGQFTVAAAMAQDHAGVTLFLIGDPASDRAILQADFSGTIQ